MKAIFTLLTIFFFVGLLAQDTPENVVSKVTQKRILTPEQIQFNKDVLYVIKNAKRAYQNIDRVDSNVSSINDNVNLIISSNQKLWDQNDSLKLIQNRILNYARESEERALNAEAKTKVAQEESRDWDRMLDLSVLIGALGAIFIIIGFNVYNTIQLSKIKRTLIV